MKRSFFLVLALMLIISIIPVSAQDATEITLWFHSGQGGERDELDAQITAFNEGQSDWAISPLQVPEGSYNDQVRAVALAGDLPCVLDFDGPFIYSYVFAGDLIALDDYASEDLLNDTLPQLSVRVLSMENSIASVNLIVVSLSGVTVPC